MPVSFQHREIHGPAVQLWTLTPGGRCKVVVEVGLGLHLHWYGLEVWLRATHPTIDHQHCGV